MEIPIVSSTPENLKDVDWDVILQNAHDTEYGEKVHVDSPYEAKDVIENLDWEKTHRLWDDEARMWSIDLDGIGHLALTLKDAGYSVAATEDVGKALDR